MVKNRLSVIIRLPSGNFSLFMHALERLILENEIQNSEAVYLGVFDIWFDVSTNNDAKRCLRLIKSIGLTNLVSKPIYSSGHNLVFVVTKNVTL